MKTAIQNLSTKIIEIPTLSIENTATIINILAKAMDEEKQQIIDAYNSSSWETDKDIEGHHYYDIKFKDKNPLIRFKIVQDIDPIFGGEYWNFSFEVFKRPYFFGLIDRKKWDRSVQTNGFTEGLSFSKYLLNIK